jgi:heterodisulfide reductase subunit B
MNRFGFGIQQDNTLIYERNKTGLADMVITSEPSLLKCIQCGSCSATCPASALSSYQFRKLQLLMRRGETEELKEEITKCMLCGKCQLVCPRGVNTRNVIRQIRIALNLN